MKSISDFLQSMKRAYEENGLDFNTALSVWKEARMNAETIKNQIQYDIGKNLSAHDVRIVYGIMSGKYERIADKIDYRLTHSKFVPANPVTISRLVKSENNVYRHKNADIDIEWVMVEKIGDNGKPTVYLARRNRKNNIEKKASVILADNFDINKQALYPSRCPAQDKGITDNLKIDMTPCCLYEGKKCKYYNNHTQGNQEKIKIDCKIDI